MDSALAGVLVGSGLTLVSTTMVQAIVVPWTQARTRRRERWEKDVHALARLLEEELPPLLGEHHVSRVSHALVSGESSAIKDERERELMAARSKLKEAADRHDILALRLPRINRGSPVWLRLMARSVLLTMAIASSTEIIPGDPTPSLAELNHRRDVAEKARLAMVKELEPLSRTMRPPRRNVLSPISRMVASKIRKLRGLPTPEEVYLRRQKAYVESVSREVAEQFGSAREAESAESFPGETAPPA